MGDKDGPNVTVTGSSGELRAIQSTPRGCPDKEIALMGSCSGPKENTVCLEFCPLGLAKSAGAERH